MRLWLTLCLLTAAPVHAEVEPISSNEDARIRVINYAPNQLIRLQLQPATDVALLFGLGEAIQSVELGDTSAFQVRVGESGDGLTVHASASAGSTVMTVRTDRHSYDITLASSASAPPTWLVRFSYAPAVAPYTAPTPAAIEASRAIYKLSGTRSLRPSKLSDDGTHTYIEWGASQAIPAVFARAPSGQEEMVNGYMREGVFTIDRVHDELVFRIDHSEAKARRSIAKARQ